MGLGAGQTMVRDEARSSGLILRELDKPGLNGMEPSPGAVPWGLVDVSTRLRPCQLAQTSKG